MERLVASLGKELLFSVLLSLSLFPVTVCAPTVNLGNLGLQPVRPTIKYGNVNKQLLIITNVHNTD